MSKYDFFEEPPADTVPKKKTGRDSKKIRELELKLQHFEEKLQQMTTHNAWELWVRENKDMLIKSIDCYFSAYKSKTTPEAQKNKKRFGEIREFLEKVAPADPTDGDKK